MRDMPHKPRQLLLPLSTTEESSESGSDALVVNDSFPSTVSEAASSSRVGSVPASESPSKSSESGMEGCARLAGPGPN